MAVRSLRTSLVVPLHRSAALVFLALLAARSEPAEEDLSLEVAPSPVEVCPGAPRADAPAVWVQVLVRNRSAPADRLQLELFTTTGLVADGDIVDPGVAPPAAGQSSVHLVRLRPSAGAEPQAGTLFFRLYGAKDGVRRLLATASVPAALVTPRPLSEVVQIEGRLSAETLDERTGAGWTLLVRNLTNRKVTVTPRVLRELGNATVKRLPGSEERIEVPPFGSVAPLFSLEGRKPGRDVAVVQAEVGWGDGRCSFQGSTLVTADIKTGASELLTILGVPTLLVLPGFLFLAVCMLCWKLGWRISAWPDFPLSASTPEFWTSAILLSFLALGLSLLVGFDYRDTYGLSEVIRLWLACVAAALATWGVVTLVYRWWDRRRLNLRDLAPQVLDKLARLGAKTYLPGVWLRRDGVQDKAVLRLPVERPSGQVWVCPAIEISLAGADDVVGALEKDLTSAAASGGRLADVAGLVRRHRRLVTVLWRGGGGIEQADEQHVVRRVPAEALIRVAVEEEQQQE